MLPFLISAYRTCYLLATHVDEGYVFCRGALTLSLDRILTKLLNFPEGMLFPDCLYALANQMLVHNTSQLLVRGRVATRFDLLAMIPASRAQAHNPDRVSAADLIDSRRRGRVMGACFLSSTPCSNFISYVEASWRRVVFASVVVMFGGVLVSRQACAGLPLQL